MQSLDANYSPVQGRRKQRGSALLLSIFFLIVLVFLADALLVLCPTELQAARQEKFQNQAYYLAEGGLITAIKMIENEALAHPATFDSAVTDSSNAPSLTLGDMLCQVTITGQGNTHDKKKVYLLTSVVTLNGRTVKQLQALIRQNSFADYGYFSDIEQPYLEYDGCYSSARTFWWYDNWKISGPFHTNGDFYVSYTPSSSNTGTTFSDKVSISGTAYFNSNLQTYEQALTSDPDLNDQLFGGNQLLNNKKINLPTDTVNLQNTAWGGNGFSQPGNGIYVNSGNLENAGIIIGGDVNVMKLYSDNGNPGVIIRQGDYAIANNGYKVITESNGTVSVQTGHVDNYNAFSSIAGSTTQSYPNLGKNFGKRVIYCTGNINSLFGENQRPTIIATAVGKDIIISGDITQRSTAKGSQPASASDALGLIGHNVRVAESLVANYMDNLYLYATIMALKDPNHSIDSGGIFSSYDRYSFQVPNGCFMADYSYHYPTPVADRKIKIYGGLVQSVRGQVGNASCGFGRDLFFDSYAADSLSAVFPQIGFEVTALSSAR